jgi:WD40 repeat protein
MNADVVYCATCGAANPLEAPTCFACGNSPKVADGRVPASAGHGSAATAALLASHPLLRQRYRLLAQIGKGGFGAVYQVEDTELGNRRVAVKEMSQRGLTPEEAQEATQAFRNEALLLASLEHPNLPRIYEQFSEGGHWYLVMDFIGGETLEGRLAHTPGGRLPVQDVVKLGLQLCTVLDYLHTRQPPIIFRDLKPANIMVKPGGDIALIDFGIARHFKPGQTKDTVAFGSAGYAAPEQYGKAQTTAQSDIYSLGATLHQCLSGSDPSDNPFLFEPLHLAEPQGLEVLIMQMLETHPSKRPAGMAAIKDDLGRMADVLATGQKQQRPLVGPTPPVVRSAPSPQRPAVVHASPSTHANSSLLVYRGHTERINALAWAPDGKTIASGGNDRTIRIWESASGDNLAAFPASDWVHALAWAPDGKQLAWGSKGVTLLNWNAGHKAPREFMVRRLGFPDGFLAVAWSPDGARLAAGGLGKTIEIWEAQTGNHLLTYSGHHRFLEDAAVYALAWAPSGQWIASVRADATVQVWEAATGNQCSTYRGYQVGYFGHRRAISWSPDGKYIASAGDQASVHIWEATTGERHLRLDGHNGTVNSVAWSPDGKCLASGGSDQTVRVWDIAVAKERMAYARHSAEVNAVAWSPDSTHLASAGDDHLVQIWQVK